MNFWLKLEGQAFRNMKRIIISILCSAALVFGYYYSLAILYQMYQISFDTLMRLLLPINLPYNIYKSIFGFYYGDRNLVKVLNFGGAILIYSIPFYLLLTVFDKRRRKSDFQEIKNPPEPPIFK